MGWKGPPPSGGPEGFVGPSSSSLASESSPKSRFKFESKSISVRKGGPRSSQRRVVGVERGEERRGEEEGGEGESEGEESTRRKREAPFESGKMK